MHDLPPNTVAAFLINPAHMSVDLTAVPLRNLVPSLQAAKAAVLNTEQALLDFYFYNHAFHLIAGAHSAYALLPTDLAEICAHYQTRTQQVAQQMFFQTLAATHGHLFALADPASKDMMAQVYGKTMMDYFSRPHNAGNFHQWLNAFPDVSLGVFVNATLTSFFCSHSGGAKAWANIARLPVDFVAGRMNLEQLADQAFSICHNGGSILNKGHMFSVCSNTMYHLLDVQDSGQIPQWVWQHRTGSLVHKRLAHDVHILRRYFDAVNTSVDNTLVAQSMDKRTAYTQKIAQNAVLGNWKNPLATPPVKPHPHAALNKTLLGL